MQDACCLRVTLRGAQYWGFVLWSVPRAGYALLPLYSWALSMLSQSFLETGLCLFKYKGSVLFITALC